MDASSTMLSSPKVLQPTADIRRDAIETKRVRDNKMKWALGTRPLPGQKEKYPGRVRPRVRLSPGHEHHRTGVTLNMPREVDMAIEDRHVNYWTLDRNLWTQSFVDYDDSDIFYSFDAPSGPVRSDRVLGAAISEAVERFENKETEKLVGEYEFVTHEDPNNGDDNTSADEDGFEIVEPVGH